MIILGISAFYHDSAAALIKDGVIIAAAQEERFTRIKHDARFPAHAVRYCLTEAGITLAEVDHIVFHEKPFIKFERLLETYIGFAPRGFESFARSMPMWIREKLFQKKLIGDHLQAILPQEDGWEQKLLFSEHHFSHAASAFYPSPFEEAVILTLDGVGEWATASVAIGRGNRITVEKEIHFPHSLGLLYSAFTYYAGFKVNSGEYKLMGLAPYGEPRFAGLIREKLIDVKDDGSFRLDMDYFDYCTGLKMTNAKFDALFGRKVRGSEEPLEQFHMDIAASIQEVTEDIMLRLTRSLAREYGIPNLCLAGGVALNCVANGRIHRDRAFRSLWIQPAAGDAGGALGAALAVHYHVLGNARTPHPRDAMRGSYLGPAYADGMVEMELAALGAQYDKHDEDGMIRATADALAQGKAIGWMQGRMEFGPRALGARSILADPRSETMQKILNLKVKYRESFRPFAPAVLHEEASGWFDLDTESPYMLLVADVKKERQRAMTEAQRRLFGIDKLNVPRSDIPAVTHVDYSARVQTVRKETNPLFYRLLQAFFERTGCPVLVNTSFNVRGEPIVCSPADAFKCFMGTELDKLVIGHLILDKQKQDVSLKQDYKHAFELD